MQVLAHSDSHRKQEEKTNINWKFSSFSTAPWLTIIVNFSKGTSSNATNKGKDAPVKFFFQGFHFQATNIPRMLSKDIMWLAAELEEKLILWFTDYFKDIPFYLTWIQGQISNILRSETSPKIARVPNHLVTQSENDAVAEGTAASRYHSNRCLDNAPQIIKQCVHI